MRKLSYGGGCIHLKKLIIVTNTTSTPLSFHFRVSLPNRCKMMPRTFFRVTSCSSRYKYRLFDCAVITTMNGIVFRLFQKSQSVGKIRQVTSGGEEKVNVTHTEGKFDKWMDRNGRGVREQILIEIVFSQNLHFFADVLFDLHNGFRGTYCRRSCILLHLCWS